MKRVRQILSMCLVIIVLFSGIGITVAAAGVTGSDKTQRSTTTEGETESSDIVTRAEWLKELTTLFEMTVEDDNYPDNYFSDLDSSSEYYYDMLLAVQFGLVDVAAGGQVCPEDPVTREFAVQTLNYCLAYQLEEGTEYTFNDSADVSCPDDAQVAINQGWLELIDGNFSPAANVTTEEVENMLSIAETVWKSTEIDEAHENVYDFADDVIVVPETTVVTVDENQTVTIGDISVAIKAGDKFAVYLNGIPCTYEATSVTESEGQLVIQTNEVSMEEAFDEVDAQGTLDADAMQIEEVEGLTYSYEEEYEEAESANARGIVNLSKIKNFNVSGKLKLTNGQSISVKHKFKKAKIEYGISRNEVFIKLMGDSELTYEFEGDILEALNCEEINILPATIPGIGGFDVILEVELGGAISGTTNGHLVAGVAYSSSGARLLKSFEVSGFSLEAEISGAIGVKARLGVTGKLVPINGYIWEKAGGKASFKQTNYNDGNTPDKCTTFAAWLYASCGATVKFELFGILDSLSFSQEYVFYDEDNSPVRIYHHYEDGKEVCECTRGEWDGYYTLGTSRYHGSGWSSGMGAYGYDAEGNMIALYTYTLDDDNNATITGYSGNANILYIPKTIDGYTVVGIGENAFANNSSVISITLSSAITVVKGGAFKNCSNLTELNFSDNVISIGNGILSGNQKIEELYIPKTVTYMGDDSISGRDGALDGSGVKKVVFEEGIEKIPSYACSGATYLEEVILPSTVTAIGGYAFQNTSLTELILPSNITSLSNGMLSGTTNLNELYIPKTVTYMGDDSISGRDGALDGSGVKKVIFEEGITRIPSYACSGATCLEEVILPDTVTEIKDYAFQNTGLIELVLPSNITSLSNGILSGTTTLNELYIPKTVTYMGDDSISGRDGALDGSGVKKVIFEEGISIIPLYACSGATYLEEVVVPNTVTEIESYAFRYTAIEKFSFPDKVQEIKRSTFQGCKLLTIINWNNSITEIHISAFENCDGLVEAEIPNTVVKIYERGFFDCDSLVKLILPDSVLYLEDSAFYDCDALKDITLGMGISEIQYKTFYSCDNLNEIKIPNSVIDIRESAFNDCDSLTEILWGTKVKNISQYAFYDCDALREIVVPDSAITIGNSAFYDCDALTTITIPDSVSSLGTKVFYDCDLLTDVTLGTGITSIPTSTFEHCDVLESIKLPYRTASIGATAFKDCVKFTSITIPRATTTIDSTAFSYPAQMTIYGVSGTYAETFATENDITFVNQEVNATEVSLNNTTLELNKGATATLVMSVTPADFTDEVVWKSTDTDVVTITDAGLVTAKAVGTATIKVTVGNVSATCKVTVVQPVTSISLNKTSLTLEALDTYQLKTTISPSTANNQTIAWSSSDESVASVDENGLVTAHKKGSATITVAAQDGSGVTKSCTVTVSNNAVIATAVEELESSHNYENSCTDFWIYTLEGAASLAVTFDDQTEIEEDFDFLYIYDVDGNEVGKYTGTELAGATVTVPGNTVKIQLDSDDSGSAWGFKVTSVQVAEEVVEKKEQTISGTKSYAKTTGDESFTLDVKTSGDGTLEFVSDNTSVATVSSSGVVTIVGEGSAVITVTASETETYKSATMEITVAVSKKACEHSNLELKNQKDATCTSEGYTGDSYCISCGLLVETGEVIEKISHSWDDGKITAEAACTDDGVKAYTCTVCGEIKKESISATGHAYEEVITPATMEEDGSIVECCKQCDDVRNEEVIAAIDTVSLNKTKLVYTGKTQSVTVTVKDTDGKKVSSDYYTVTNTSKKSVGVYTVTVTFKGNYSGTEKIKYSIVPKKPSSLTAELYQYGNQVKITWTKSTGATGYRIYFKKPGGTTYTYLTSTTKLTYTKSGLTQSKKYTFKVIPYYATSSSSKTHYYGTGSGCYITKAITTTTKGSKLATVSKPTVAKSGTKVKVTWKNISGETGYQISRSTSSTGTNIVSTYKTTTGTSKVISAVKGTKYYYKVRAYRVVNGKTVYGEWSAVRSYTRK